MPRELNRFVRFFRRHFVPTAGTAHKRDTFTDNISMFFPARKAGLEISADTKRNPRLVEASSMNITNVKIRKMFPEGKIRAIVSIILDGDFAVHDLKIIEGVERMFVAMPNRRSDDGRFQDIVHPISAEARRTLEDTIIAAYEHAKAEGTIPASRPSAESPSVGPEETE